MTAPAIVVDACPAPNIEGQIVYPTHPNVCGVTAAVRRYPAIPASATYQLTCCRLAGHAGPHVHTNLRDFTVAWPQEHHQ